jgi:hypothetical protein
VPAIPQWLAEQGRDTAIDVGSWTAATTPFDQITEFLLVAERIPVGGQLLSHDAKLGAKWLRPYIEQLDNWKVQLHDVSAEGLLQAVKIGAAPSDPSRRAAATLLRKLRLHPVELVGRYLPASVCRWLLDLMPAKLRPGPLRECETAIQRRNLPRSHRTHLRRNICDDSKAAKA